MTQLDSPYLLTTDIDLTFSADYKRVVEYGADADISYLCDKAEVFNPRGIWCANQLFLRNTEFSRQFCRALSHFLRQKMNEENRIYWYLDQFVLVRLWHQLGIGTHPKCKNINDVQFDKPPFTMAIANTIKLSRHGKLDGMENKLRFDMETLRPYLCSETTTE